MALLEKVYGENSTDIPRICNNLALVYSKQKKWSQAIPMHTRAVQLAEKVVGADSLDLALYLSAYSQTLRKMSNNVEADKIADRAKAIRTKAANKEKGDK